MEYRTLGFKVTMFFQSQQKSICFLTINNERVDFGDLNPALQSHQHFVTVNKSQYVF